MLIHSLYFSLKLLSTVFSILRPVKIAIYHKKFMNGTQYGDTIFSKQRRCFLSTIKTSIQFISLNRCYLLFIRFYLLYKNSGETHYVPPPPTPNSKNLIFVGRNGIFPDETPSIALINEVSKYFNIIPFCKHWACCFCKLISSCPPKNYNSECCHQYELFLNSYSKFNTIR